MYAKFHAVIALIGHSAMNALFGIIRAWTYQLKSFLQLTKFSGFVKFAIDFSIVHITFLATNEPAIAGCFSLEDLSC